MSDPLDDFRGYAKAVHERLEAGRETYGDRSFSFPPTKLIAELQLESLDLGGWGYVLYERLRAASEAAAVLEYELEHAQARELQIAALKQQLEEARAELQTLRSMRDADER